MEVIDVAIKISTNIEVDELINILSILPFFLIKLLIWKILKLVLLK